MAVTYLKKIYDQMGGPGFSSDIDPTIYDVLKAVITELKALRVAFNAHTHMGDGSEAGEYTTSTPGLDTELEGITGPTAAATVTQYVDYES